MSERELYRRTALYQLRQASKRFRTVVVGALRTFGEPVCAFLDRALRRMT